MISYKHLEEPICMYCFVVQNDSKEVVLFILSIVDL
jgi:hypothetical protein